MLSTFFHSLTLRAYAGVIHFSTNNCVLLMIKIYSRAHLYDAGGKRFWQRVEAHQAAVKYFEASFEIEKINQYGRLHNKSQSRL